MKKGRSFQNCGPWFDGIDFSARGVTVPGSHPGPFPFIHSFPYIHLRIYLNKKFTIFVSLKSHPNRIFVKYES